MLREVRGPTQQQHPRHIASFLRAAAVPISPSMHFHLPATSAETQGRPAGRSVCGVSWARHRERLRTFSSFFFFFRGICSPPSPCAPLRHHWAQGHGIAAEPGRAPPPPSVLFSLVRGRPLNQEGAAAVFPEMPVPTVSGDLVGARDRN